MTLTIHIRDPKTIRDVKGKGVATSEPHDDDVLGREGLDFNVPLNSIYWNEMDAIALSAEQYLSPIHYDDGSAGMAGPSGIGRDDILPMPLGLYQDDSKSLTQDPLPSAIPLYKEGDYIYPTKDYRSLSQKWTFPFNHENQKMTQWEMSIFQYCDVLDLAKSMRKGLNKFHAPEINKVCEDIQGNLQIAVKCLLETHASFLHHAKLARKSGKKLKWNHLEKGLTMRKIKTLFHPLEAFTKKYCSITTRTPQGWANVLSKYSPCMGEGLISYIDQLQFLSKHCRVWNQVLSIERDALFAYNLEHEINEAAPCSFWKRLWKS